MIDTLFAPAQRATPEALAEEAAALRTMMAFCASLDAMPTMVLVLNAERQMVVANRTAVRFLGLRPGEGIGCRPGELVHCAGAVEGPDGCGTAERCRVCGAVNAVLRSASSGEQVTSDCRIMLQGDGGALDLEVVATPFTTAGRAYTIVSLRDIAAEKRGEVLERLFFHDIINTAGNINGLTRIMADMGATASDIQLLAQCSDQLLEEIRSHRDLLAAERGTLVVEFTPLRLPELLMEIGEAYRQQDLAQGRTLRLDVLPEVAVESDRVLLRRAIGNLVKNALEASHQGDAVTIGLAAVGEAARITVHNPCVVPEEVKHQVFQRSFSTKGKGRGLGTYGSRLLVERYLGGTLSFVSEAGKGTVVSLAIPLAGKAGKG